MFDPTVVYVNGFSIHPVVNENRKGSYGIVVDAVRLSDGKEFVMKLFGYTKNKPDISYILREIDNLQVLNSVPGVAHIETIFNDSVDGYISKTVPKLYKRIYPIIVMERLKGGELFERILSKDSQNESFSETDAALIFKTFITALDQIHTEKNMINIDLKSENLVFSNPSDYESIKIIDFGMAVSLYNRDEHFEDKLGGTEAYLAPESITHYDKYGQALFSRASDVWQAGCILYTLLTVSFPFGSNKTPDLHARIKSRRFVFQDLAQIQIRFKLSNEVTDLFDRMFAVDPAARMTCREILNHPWIVNSVEDKLSSISFGDDYFNRLRSFQCQRKFRQLLNQSTILFIQEQLQAELSTTKYIDEPEEEDEEPTQSLLGFSIIEASPSDNPRRRDSLNGIDENFADYGTPRGGSVHSSQDHNCYTTPSGQSRNYSLHSQSSISAAFKTLNIIQPVLAKAESKHAGHINSSSHGQHSSSLVTTPGAAVPKRVRNNQNRRVVTVKFVITNEGIKLLKEKFLEYQHAEISDEAAASDSGLDLKAFQEVVLSAGFSNLATERVFNIFDYNHSGTVDYLEFLLALSSFRRDIDWDDLESVARLYYDIFDVNSDGSISVEVLALVLNKLEHDFALFTVGNKSQQQPDGMQSMAGDDEVDGMEVEIELNMFDGSVYQLVEFIDTDKDGSVSYEEFEQFVKTLNKLKVTSTSRANSKQS